jgi:hypothetical protein
VRLGERPASSAPLAFCTDRIAQRPPKRGFTAPWRRHVHCLPRWALKGTTPPLSMVVLPDDAAPLTPNAVRVLVVRADDSVDATDELVNQP